MRLEYLNFIVFVIGWLGFFRDKWRKILFILIFFIGLFRVLMIFFIRSYVF